MCPAKLGVFITHEEGKNGLGRGVGVVPGSVCHSQLLFIELLLCTRCLTPFVHLILTTPMADESYDRSSYLNEHFLICTKGRQTVYKYRIIVRIKGENICLVFASFSTSEVFDR